jgi:hypothetical protein
MAEASSEDPVQEPGGEPVPALLIEAFAEYPVVAAVLVLDAVIVAGACSQLTCPLTRRPRLEVGVATAFGGGRVRGDYL